MARYTVRDEQTGKNITFDWHGEKEPTDTDFEEIFAETRNIKSPQQAAPITAPQTTEPSFAQQAGQWLTGLLEGRKLSPEETQSATEKAKAIATGQAPLTLPKETEAMMVPGAGVAAVPGTILQGAGKGITVGAGLLDTLRKVAPAAKPMPTVIEKAGTPAEVSEKFKVPITYGEETGSPFWQKTETMLEKIPVVGTGGFREKQAEATKQAAQNFLGKYIVNPQATDIAAENRAYASALYEDIKTTLEGVKTSKMIRPSETGKVTKDLLGQFPATLKQLGDARTENMLRDVLAETKEGLSFSDMWELRKNIGSLIGQARKQINAGQMNETQHGRLKELFGAISKDMEGWAAQSKKPEITRLFNEANNAYKNYVVKHDIVQRAYDKAAGTVGAAETFSPKTFSTELKKLMYKDKAFKLFTSGEVEEMAGLANIMQVAKRGGMYLENPPTGARWGGITAGALGGGGAVAAGAPAVGAIASGAGMVGALNFLTTTPAGKTILRTAGRVAPNSKTMESLMRKIAPYSIPAANIPGNMQE